MRELEQCIRRILLKRSYTGDQKIYECQEQLPWINSIQKGDLKAEEVVAHYCTYLYEKHNNYEAVARITNLDRRTVKRYILMDRS